MVKIAGSFLKIQDDFEKIKTLDRVCDLVHFDVMDGKFTEKATLPIEKLKDVILDLKKPFDVHLMVKEIKKYIDLVAPFNPSYIIFHLEATKNAIELINYIHFKGIKAGIAINPKTKVAARLFLLEFARRPSFLPKPIVPPEAITNRTKTPISDADARMKEYVSPTSVSSNPFDIPVTKFFGETSKNVMIKVIILLSKVLFVITINIISITGGITGIIVRKKSIPRLLSFRISHLHTFSLRFSLPCQ